MSLPISVITGEVVKSTTGFCYIVGSGTASAATLIWNGTTYGDCLDCQAP
jgi:hypothetical protein